MASVSEHENYEPFHDPQDQNIYPSQSVLLDPHHEQPTYINDWLSDTYPIKDLKKNNCYIWSLKHVSGKKPKPWW